MAGSTFGRLLQLSTFGESHGGAVGGVLDGFPPNFKLNLVDLQSFVDKRRPGQSHIVTQRKEADKIEFLSGLLNETTLGTPIAFQVRNTDARGKDYNHLTDAYRPSHADYTYQQKYGIRDVSGGGRASARETVARVIAGGICKQWLSEQGIHIQAYVDQVGDIQMKIPEGSHQFPESAIEATPIRCPDPAIASDMLHLVEKTRKAGDSVGGTIFCRTTGVPAGWGEPVFDKLHAVLGHALFSINAVKGVEFGAGFKAASWNGSQHNDVILPGGKTATNHAGGIVGGISNGMPIDVRVAFKPTATLLRNQESINAQNETITVQGKGRHDPCVAPRAVVIVEAMIALVLADFYLLQNALNFSK